MQNFNRQLSLEIDWCHWQLDGLATRPGLAATLARVYWRWRLRRAERRIP